MVKMVELLNLTKKGDSELVVSNYCKNFIQTNVQQPEMKSSNINDSEQLTNFILFLTKFAANF